MEEVQRMRLHQLPVVQEPAELLGGRRQRAIAGDDIHRLGRREQVANRADAAEALHGDRNFPIRPALGEDLEAAKLDNMQPDLMDPVLPVEEDRHPAVALDPGHGFDGDAAQLLRCLRSFEVEHERSSQS